MVNPEGSRALTAASGTCRSSWNRASALFSIVVCANIRVAKVTTIAAIAIHEIVRRDGRTIRTSAHSVGQFQSSWECGIEFAKGSRMTSGTLRSLTSGAVGALTLTMIHEV